jgi:hypothetical protein
MLEEKLDLLTKEMVALRKAIEENTAAGGATAIEENTAAGGATASGKAASAEYAPAAKRGRGRPAKEEPAPPTHDRDEVETIVRQVSRDVGKPAAVKIIKSFKCDDLADLLSHPEHFDAAFEAAEAALTDTSGGDEEDDI